jgi:hypothetical protein
MPFRDATLPAPVPKEASRRCDAASRSVAPVAAPIPAIGRAGVARSGHRTGRQAERAASSAMAPMSNRLMPRSARSRSLSAESSRYVRPLISRRRLKAFQLWIFASIFSARPVRAPRMSDKTNICSLHFLFCLPDLKVFCMCTIVGPELPPCSIRRVQSGLCRLRGACRPAFRTVSSAAGSLACRVVCPLVGLRGADRASGMPPPTWRRFWKIWVTTAFANHRRPGAGAPS